MNRRSARSNAALALVLAGLTTMLFVGGPGDEWPRSLRHLWDLGHVALFAVAALLALRWGIAGWSPIRQVGSIAGGAAAFGGVTEWLQRGSDRSASMGDLQRDVIGAALILVFASPAVARLSRWQRTGAQLTVILALGWQVAPVLRATLDEFAARRGFPVLSDLEHPFEADRWRGNAEFQVVEDPVRSGHRALRVELGTTRYSGVSLGDFRGDWSGFQTLTFSVFNPDRETLKLVCKVNDREHRRRGYRHEDRFNRRLTVGPGWNDFLIPLEEVRSAPEEREMDLDQVVTLQWFAVRLSTPRVIYLDRVALQ